MKHIKPLHRGNLNKEDKIIQKGWRMSVFMQSACKTSCTVANQVAHKNKGLQQAFFKCLGHIY